MNTKAQSYVEAIAILLAILAASMGAYLAWNSTPPVDGLAIACQDICSSNNATYIRYTSSGYAGGNHACYCTMSDGRINTWVM